MGTEGARSFLTQNRYDYQYFGIVLVQTENYTLALASNKYKANY